MSIQQYNRFVALLTIVAAIAAVVLLIPAVRRKVAALDLPTTWMAWSVAIACTGGSLLYSEHFRFPPCTLCWYQRIAMYPLVVILLVGAIRRDPATPRFAVPLAGVGAVLAGYHILIQNMPRLDLNVCTLGVPCTNKFVNEFGFVSIPVMALAGFAVIGALVTIRPEEER